MATKILRFRGHPHVKPGHVWPTPPLVGPVHVNDAGKTRHGWLPGDELVVDRALAQQYNRVCACHEDGECWAYMHADAWKSGRTKVFDVLDVPDESSDEVEKPIGTEGGAPDADGEIPADADSDHTDDPVQTTAPQTPHRRRTQTARS
jgi:hypothetical protein